LHTTVFSATKDEATTFRNNSYIHCLNRTLQSELRLKATYAGLTPHDHPSNYTSLQDKHHANSQKLIRLIILNRGIPEESAPFSVGLSRKLGQFCKNIPQALGQSATKLTVQQLLTNLKHNYDRLILEAPYKDLETIKALRDISNYKWENTNESELL